MQRILILMVWNVSPFLCFQSKKHANKVRRFLSLDNENGNAVKKPKTSNNVSQ